MKFMCFTLGCKVNQYETQAMEQLLVGLGHEIGTEGACDCYIVNTCTVTAVADRKNRTLIRRLRKNYPLALLGVCGCYSQLESEAVKALGVDVVSGSAGREAFLQMLLQVWRERAGAPVVSTDRALGRRTFERLPAGGLSERTRAMLKVQDGCTNFCTYCIIPYARGPVRSLPLAEAVAQAKALAGRGYREIVLTGIEVAAWGRDLKTGETFCDLVEAVCLAVPGVRVRLGSLEPRVVDEDFGRRLAALENFCPQFHLSLQSGSDTVLARMNRKYDTARYLAAVELLNAHFPGCAITTDLIVGFPGETEAELEASLAFLQTCGFAAVHVFPYSRRPGTPAARMEGQLTAGEKSARSKRAVAAAAALSHSFREKMVGRLEEVLFEQTAGDCFTGHAANGVLVYARGADLEGVLLQVRIIKPYQDGVLAEILES